MVLVHFRLNLKSHPKVKYSKVFGSGIFILDWMCESYLHWNVPGHVVVVLVFVKPNLSHTKPIAPHEVPQGLFQVWFLEARDMSYAGARQHLHAATTQPHLQGTQSGKILQKIDH